MKDRSEPVGSVAVLVASALLAAAIVGGGVYYYFTRQVVSIQQRAAAAEAEARMQAELARQQATAARTARASSASAAASEMASALIGGASAPDAARPEEDPRQTILKVLEEQRTAWNGGDVDGFMRHYWESDELTFSSAGETTRGWNATLDRYRKRYPTREAMGQLDFSDLEVVSLDDAAALVLGQWRLSREKPVGGNFSIIFRKFDDRWLIVHDHTSVQQPDEKDPAVGSAAAGEASEEPAVE